MKRLTLLTVFLLLFGCATFPALGNTIGYGARAVAMGGAFSAIADDGTAFYWNPALLPESSKFGFAPGVGVEGDWDVSKDVLNLETYPPEFPTLTAGCAAYLGFSSRYVALNVFGEVNAETINLSEAVSNGIARLDGYGALTFAKSFDGRWGIGINLKAVHCEYGEYAVNVYYDPSNPSYNPDDNYIITGNADGIAADLGLYFRINEQLRLALVGRNCTYDISWEGEKQRYNVDGTEYGTATPQTLTYGLPQTYTLGVAYQPIENTLFALDLVSYQTDADDLFQIHFGIEQSLFDHKLAVRLGGIDDGADSKNLTAGLGFKFGPLVLDTAAVFPEDSENGYYLTLGLDF